MSRSLPWHTIRHLDIRVIIIRLNSFFCVKDTTGKGISAENAVIRWQQFHESIKQDILLVADLKKAIDN